MSIPMDTINFMCVSFFSSISNLIWPPLFLSVKAFLYIFPALSVTTGGGGDVGRHTDSVKRFFVSMPPSLSLSPGHDCMSGDVCRQNATSPSATHRRSQSHEKPGLPRTDRRSSGPASPLGPYRFTRSTAVPVPGCSIDRAKLDRLSSRYR